MTNFGVDAIGRLTTIAFPDGSWEYTAYEHGSAKSWRNRQGITKTSDFDARGRECNTWWDDNDVTLPIGRAWRDDNRLSFIQNTYPTPSGRAVFSRVDYNYDAAGQVASEGTQVAGSAWGIARVGWLRYPNGSVAHLQAPGYSVYHAWTARGQLIGTGWADGAGNFAGRFVSYNWQADGKLWGQTSMDGLFMHRVYDDAGRISGQALYNTSTSPWTALLYRGYARDARDRIWAISKGYNPSVNPMENGRGEHFDYDAEGQLTQALYECTDPVNGNPAQYYGATRGENWNYDQLGNRQGWNNISRLGWQPWTRRDNGLNQYLHWGGQPANYDAPAYGAGSNGVLVQDNFFSADYNALKQARWMWAPNAGIPPGQVMCFGYDPLGRCVKRWVGAPEQPGQTAATYLYYNDWNLIEESDGSNLQRLYVHGARVDEISASLRVNVAWYAHHYDARTHCIALTHDCLIQEQYAYDAFGWPRIYGPNGGAELGTSQLGNRFLFTGREWLASLRVYDYRHRFYHPELGRFLQPDPLHFAAGDHNLYRYCHNDPVNNTDPFGLEPPAVVIKRMEGISSQQATDVARAFRLFSSTASGMAMLDAIGSRQPYITITITSKEVNQRETGKSNIFINTGEKVPLDTKNGGWILACLARIIGHEFAHFLIEKGDEASERELIRKYESPFVRELQLHERTRHGISIEESMAAQQRSSKENPCEPGYDFGAPWRGNKFPRLKDG